MTNGSPLLHYRQKAGLTLEAAGAMFGVNKTTFMRWEAGSIPAERALEIERITKVPRERLRPDLYPPPISHLPATVSPCT